LHPQKPSLLRRLLDILSLVLSSLPDNPADYSRTSGNPRDNSNSYSDNCKDSTFRPLRVVIEGAPPPSIERETREISQDRRDQERIGIDRRRLNIEAICAGISIFAMVATLGSLWVAKRSADAANESASLARKQMEALKAAVVAIPDVIVMQFTVPPFGEARPTLKNTGQVNAHDVHLKVAVTLKGVDGRTSKDLTSGEQVIRALGPDSEKSFIYPFALSDADYQAVMNTASYIEAQGFWEYENGFQPIPKQDFCYAYIWGSQKFGRWSGECSQISSQIQLARKLARE